MINKTIMKLMGVVVMLFAFAQVSNAMEFKVKQCTDTGETIFWLTVQLNLATMPVFNSS